MAPRLLSLLTLIETALANHGVPAVKAPARRSISFHKGLAQMTFSDGSGSILVQNFTLTDGAICVKVVTAWTGVTATGLYSIYPGEGFNWMAAADKIAAMWMEGSAAGATASPEQREQAVAESEPEASAEALAAAG